MEKVFSAGWRFLGKEPDEIRRLTPREFYVLLEAENERKYDRLEEYAISAMMNAKANNSKKRVKLSDLFKRPEQENAATKKVEDLYEKQKQASEWLSQFEIK
ncbi:phage tail assembly chaperone [Bacillus swezeyi]|uniref:phage tail assembly chaperone n=1 Tax=Bacillus swezeyi TaxID=1925020 RepID=UPI00399CBEB7